jgi:2-keto-4-pentenoate hydratase
MKVGELIRLLEEDGWRLTRTRSSHRQYKNPKDIAGQRVTLLCNGRPRRHGSAADALDHPIHPVVWLANELSRTRVGLKAGQIVSTGTLTDMLSPKTGETYVADFGPFGPVTLAFTSRSTRASGDMK